MVFVKKGSGKSLLSLELTSTLHTQRYASISKALRASILPIDNKSLISESVLALLTDQLFQHYQQYYGKTSVKPRPITIPSSQLFLDLEEDGALYVMLSTLLIGATVRELTPVEKIFDNLPATLLPILHDIDKNLSLYGFTTSPRVFLKSIPVSLINRLSKIVKEHGGELVTSEEQATHVVDWNEDIDNNYENNPFYVDEQNARAIDVKALSENGDGLYYLIHWPFLPDSANEWVLESAATLSLVEQQAAVQGRKDKLPNFVACRYLFDVDNYNEWGNEADYEVSTVSVNSSSLPTEEADKDVTAETSSTNDVPASTNVTKDGSEQRSFSSTASVAAQTAAQKDKKIPLPVLASSLYEKFFADILPENLTRSIFQGAVQTSRVLDVDFPTARIAPTTTTTTVGATSSSTTTAVNVKHEPTEDAQESLGVSKKRKIDDISSSASSSVSANCPAVLLSMDKISEFERRLLSAVIREHLPHGESSYLQMRNAMLQLYLQRPQQYLSATDCRRKLTGDVARITRLHEFLDAFGAINYAVKPEARPASSVPATVAAENKCDFELSQRRRELVDRIAQRYPSCAVYDTVTASLNTAATGSTGANTTVNSMNTTANVCTTTIPVPASFSSSGPISGPAAAATLHWTRAMDSHLLRVVRSTEMDWAAVSREMGRCLEADYLSRPESSSAAGGVIVKDEHTSNSHQIKQEDDRTQENNNTHTNNSNNNNGSGSGSSDGGEENEVTSRQRLTRLSPMQRQALVTPLLCMLRFMELQMSGIARSTASTASTGANAAGPGVESHNNGSGSDSGSPCSRAASMFTHPALLTQHPTVLAATVVASGAGTGVTIAEAEMGAGVSSATAVVSRITQAIAHLVALDRLLQDTSSASSTSSTDSNSNNHNCSNYDHDMDVDESPTRSFRNPESAISHSIRSLASQWIAQLTSKTSDFMTQLQYRQELLMRTVLDSRVASLEAKLSLIEEAEKVLQSERDQLEIDKREFFLQKLLHVTTSQGLSLQVPNRFQPTTGAGAGGMTANSAMLGSYGSSNNMFAGGTGGGLSTSASSTALASMMMM